VSGEAARRRLKDLDAQLVHTLERQAVDAVIDVGANQGQFARRVRAGGWRGPILSIEPIAELHPGLRAQAEADDAWELAAPFAAGDRDAEVMLEISAERDMSSTLRQSGLLQAISPSSQVVRRVAVPQRRLDAVDLLGRPWRRMFVKVDVQGAEPAVLAGLAGVWSRVRGLQLELALVPLYQGERPWLELITDLAARDFAPHLLIPGYYSRALGRQVQVDVVFFRG
jgi:FkbM family methyltransferase